MNAENVASLGLLLGSCLLAGCLPASYGPATMRTESWTQPGPVEPWDVRTDLEVELHDQRPGAGWKRPLTIVTVTYGAAIAGWALLPSSVSKFNDSSGIENFLDGFRSAPQWDSDHWIVNYVFHPLTGSETHIMARYHGMEFWEAFAFDLFCSVYWEYGPENFFEHPSLNDLLITAPVGALLGELRYRARRRLAGKSGSGARILRGLLDPFGDFYRKGRPSGGTVLRLGGDDVLIGYGGRF